MTMVSGLYSHARTCLPSAQTALKSTVIGGVSSGGCDGVASGRGVTAIVTVDKAVSLCNDPRAAGLKILLIVSTPENLLRVAREVKDIPQINVGNYGRIAPKHGTEARKTYTKNLYAYEDEVEVLRQVMATGIPCNVQTIPDDVPQELSKVLG